jgi:cytochrome c2
MKSLLSAGVLLALIATAFAASTALGDSLQGRGVFRDYCATCHSLDPKVAGKRGPHLADLFKRRYGALQGFPYRMVWTEADPLWTSAHLDAYLEIHRLPEPGHRKQVIEFLEIATTGALVIDAAKGETLYNTKCSYCHDLARGTAPTGRNGEDPYEDIKRALESSSPGPREPTFPRLVDKGAVRRGPPLDRLFGRAPGAVSGFPYRFVFEIEGSVWTEADLESYIEFHARLEKFDRADLVAFLKHATR